MVMANNKKILANLINQQIGTSGWFPVADWCSKQKFGKIVDMKVYLSHCVWEIQFEDNSKAFLTDKGL